MPTYIKFKLPFCLYLQDGMYSVRVPELGTDDPVLIELSKFRREKEKIDYVTFWRAELVGRAELWNDRNGVFRRSSAIIIFPLSIIPDDFDNVELRGRGDTELLIESTVKALNRLISIYRFVTGDTYIPILQATDIYNTFEFGRCIFSSDGSMSRHSRQAGFDNRLTNTRPDYDNTTEQEIRNLLAKSDPIPLFEEFMMNARSLLDERNWRASAIEIQTAFEIFVASHVRNYYTGRRTPKTALDKIMKCGFMNLLTTHLNRATGKTFTRGQPHYDQWLNDTYLLRNKVVHEGYIPSQQEAYNAVIAVEQTLEYLLGRRPDKYWPQVQPPTQVSEFIIVE